MHLRAFSRGSLQCEEPKVGDAPVPPKTVPNEFRIPNLDPDKPATRGGGSYGLTTIFSGDQNSEWYLPSKQVEASAYLPCNLLAFSDDFAGGLYVLKVADDGIANESVFYWNQDGGLVETDYVDVFEFVAKFAYEPA